MRRRVSLNLFWIPKMVCLVMHERHGGGSVGERRESNGHVGCRIRHGLGAVLVAACLLAGCDGGGSSSSSKLAEEHSVAVANGVCAELKAYEDAQGAHEGTSKQGSETEQFLAHKETEIARLRAVMSSASTLPGVRVYISDLAAQDRPLTALSNALRRDDTAYFQRIVLSRSYAHESYRLDAKVANDEKALGLTSCIAPSTRRAIEG